MTSAFGGQHSIQLSYGCALGIWITETLRHMQRLTVEKFIRQFQR